MAAGVTLVHRVTGLADGVDVRGKWEDSIMTPASLAGTAGCMGSLPLTLLPKEPTPVPYHWVDTHV